MTSTGAKALTDGDGSIPLVSLGLVARDAWRRNAWTTGGIRPGRRGQRGPWSEPHVLIPRIASFVTELNPGGSVVKIREYAPRAGGVERRAAGRAGQIKRRPRQHHGQPRDADGRRRRGGHYRARRGCPRHVHSGVFELAANVKRLRRARARRGGARRGRAVTRSARSSRVLLIIITAHRNRRPFSALFISSSVGFRPS